MTPINTIYNEMGIRESVLSFGKSIEKDLKERFEKEFMQRPEWKSLQAVKNNRVHFLPGDLFLYMPGPRYPEAFRYLAKLLYPEMAF